MLSYDYGKAPGCITQEVYIYIYIHPIIKLCVYRIDMCMMENVLSNSCMTKLKATGNC